MAAAPAPAAAGIAAAGIAAAGIAAAGIAAAGIAAAGITVFIKQHTGRTIVLDGLRPDTGIDDVLKLAWEKRSSLQVTLPSFVSAVTLYHGGRTLAAGTKLSDWSITSSATIYEVPQSWTMSPDVDWATLTCPDPTTGKAIVDPVVFNPGCLHVHERSSLSAWKSAHNAGALFGAEALKCPACGVLIEECHLTKF